jgi:pilus assembly protein CpaC
MSGQFNMNNASRLSRTILLSALCLVGPAIFAQDSGQAATSAPATTQGMPAQAPAAQVPASQGQESSEPQTLHLLVGRSLVITSPSRIKRISLADPEIAEAIVVSPTQVLVNGRKPGGVSLLLWDETDQSQAFEVSVDIDVLGLSQKIHEVFPAENVHIDTSKDVVIITGKISSSVVADKILEVVKGAAPKVTSMMEVPSVPTGEILLQVRFAEIDRTALTELGFNILSTGVGKTIGSLSTRQFGGVSAPAITDTFPVRGPQGNPSETFSTTQTLTNALNIFLFNPNIHLGTAIQALQSKNLFQVLAEPNLMTESGKEANFLAGGEFPYPSLQSSGGTGSSNAVTIQFKEFGIRLSFTPILAADGTIHLKVKPEVSTLDFANAVTLNGFVLPALSTRRVESEMSLADGQTFAIAGLVDNRVTELMSKIPGIGDIPVLGKLFQSKSFNKSKNELLVIVTPHIVRPLSPDQVPHGPNFPQPFLDQISPAQPKASGSK